MENVRYRLANDQFEKDAYYVDTGYMYLEQDLATGQVKDVTDVYISNQNAVEYQKQKPLAITSGSRAGSVIMTRNEPLVVGDDPAIVTRSSVMHSREGSVIIPKREGSVIIPKREGSVIVTRKEGSVIMPRKEGSVILRRKDGSVVNGSVIRGPVGYPAERIIQRTVNVPRERMVLSPRERIVTTRDRPQTVRVIRSNGYAPSVRSIPEGSRVAYVMDDSHLPGRYATRRVLVRSRDDIERDYDNNIQRLYKTTINVASESDSSSENGPKEVVKTRYISSPSNRFKNVKGVPAAKMYVPTSSVKPSKNSNSDSDSSSLDSVDIKTFEKDGKKGKRYNKKK